MNSIFNGHCNNGASLHMVHYFDGQRLSEVELTTLAGIISWTERTVPGILEPGIDYRTAKRRLAALEEKATRRA